MCIRFCKLIIPKFGLEDDKLNSVSLPIKNWKMIPERGWCFYSQQGS